MSKVPADYMAKEISKELAGWVIVKGVAEDIEGTDLYGRDPFYGFDCRKGNQKRVVWIFKDPEGNGPGFLEIEPAEKANTFTSIDDQATRYLEWKLALDEIKARFRDLVSEFETRVPRGPDAAQYWVELTDTIESRVWFMAQDALWFLKRPYRQFVNRYPESDSDE